MPVGLSSSASA